MFRKNITIIWKVGHRASVVSYQARGGLSHEGGVNVTEREDCQQPWRHIARCHHRSPRACNGLKNGNLNERGRPRKEAALWGLVTGTRIKGQGEIQPNPNWQKTRKTDSRLHSQQERSNDPAGKLNTKAHKRKRTMDGLVAAGTYYLAKPAENA